MYYDDRERHKFCLIRIARCKSRFYFFVGVFVYHSLLPHVNAMNSIPRRLFGKNTAICFTGQHTFHYPGHGSHYPGMDFSLYKNNKIANKIVDEAEATLGFKISDILFGDKSNEKVARASHAQPAILLHSIILQNEVE